MIPLNLQTHEQDSDFIKIHDKTNNLTDYNLGELAEPLHVIWPKSDCNFAWDLMIFESINQSNKIVHLFQIKKSDDQKDLIETIGKHFLIIIRIFSSKKQRKQLDKEYTKITSDRNKPAREDLASYDFKLYFISSLSSFSQNFPELLKNETRLRIEALKLCQSKLDDAKTDLKVFQKGLKKLQKCLPHLGELKEFTFKKWLKNNPDVVENLIKIIEYLKNELTNNFSKIMNFEFPKSLNKLTLNDSQPVSVNEIDNLIKNTADLIKKKEINITENYRKIFEYFYGQIEKLIEKVKKTNFDGKEKIESFSLDDLGKFEKEKCVLIDKKSLNEKSKFLKLKSKSNVNKKQKLTKTIN
ncbi:unnamed protein product [Brachionus calyciflorus]|uniref:Uncharacterized protein n=1 Tax=Brachionus calyciflorus TaxID=104777 RepID=A0A814GWX8_9BILA|nr:unnamed protein product [Brachionus calyciflorus]